MISEPRRGGHSVRDAAADPRRRSLAGGLLAFPLELDDYVVSTFNAGIGNTTLPLYIYSAIKFGVSPEINAISTIIVALTAVAIFLAWRFGRLRGAEPRSQLADEAAA